MSIDLNKMPPPELRGYQIRHAGGNLIIAFERNFDTTRSSDHWAAVVTHACLGPYQYIEVRVDGMVMISSTIIAGLVHLVDHYTQKGTKAVCIAGASDRVVRSLEMMKLCELFAFGSAEEVAAKAG